MKEYKKILDALTPDKYRLIEHAWGQAPETIYHQIMDAWNVLQKGQKIFLLSRKVYGLARVIAFLKEQGLEPVIVGKAGSTDTRMVEILKQDEKMLEPISFIRPMSFVFRKKKYDADVGGAIFSKTGLDHGTRFLLDVFFKENFHHRAQVVGDLGAGWGALSLVLATELPTTKIVAFERERGAVDALRKNLSDVAHVEVVAADVTEQKTVSSFRETFDVLLSNFAFHITSAERDAFFSAANVMLANHGIFLIVAEGKFVASCKKSGEKFFRVINIWTQGRYGVFLFSKKYS